MNSFGVRKAGEGMILPNPLRLMGGTGDLPENMDEMPPGDPIWQSRH
jgi:hypothetical protein